MLVEVGDEAGVRTLVLNRPEKLNAFNQPLLGALLDALRAAEADDEVRVVVLTGAGRAFSSGADLSELSQVATPEIQASELVPEPPPEHESTRGSGIFDDLIATLAAYPKPLLMAVNGLGVGFGATILDFADLVFLSTEARLRYPFTLHGVPPEAASSDLLVRRVGRQNAAWLLLSSEWVEADEAHRMGLAWKLCPPDEVLATAQVHAQVLAARSPAGLRMVKRSMNAPLIEPTLAAHRFEMSQYKELSGSDG
jgi:enoyl-CoA hydratase/carnithine racemase